MQILLLQTTTYHDGPLQEAGRFLPCLLPNCVCRHATCLHSSAPYRYDNMHFPKFSLPTYHFSYLFLTNSLVIFGLQPPWRTVLAGDLCVPLWEGLPFTVVFDPACILLTMYIHTPLYVYSDYTCIVLLVIRAVSDIPFSFPTPLQGHG